jgi:hypothetical protein
MTPAEFQLRILVPAAARFPYRDSPEARALLTAIAGQESGWADRIQQGGTARGWWQCEKDGAVLGVLTHPDAGRLLKGLCVVLAVPANLDMVYEAIAWCDPLAYALARLLLWTDPQPLPAIGDQAGAWSYYERLWRPGRPRPDSWPDRYAAALSAASNVA